MKYLFTLFSLLIGFSCYGQLTLGDSLFAHYPFNGNAQDESGNGYDGTVIGATLAADRWGNPNSAYQFDGVNDYIHTFTSFDFDFRTLSMWANPFDVSGNGFTEKHIAGQDANSLAYGQLKAKFSNGNLEVRAGGEANNYVYGVTPNVWYHIVLVRDGGQCRYYLDNNLIGTAASGTVGSSGSPNPDFVIGTGRELINQFFLGLIDDIRIYNRALTGGEVDSLFNEANPATYLEPNADSFNLKLFPNPVQEELKIQSEYPIVKVQIFDAMGALTYQQEGLFSRQVQLTTSKFEQGVYFVLIEDTQGRLRRGKMEVWR